MVGDAQANRRSVRGDTWVYLDRGERCFFGRGIPPAGDRRAGKCGTSLRGPICRGRESWNGRKVQDSGNYYAPTSGCAVFAAGDKQLYGESESGIGRADSDAVMECGERGERYTEFLQQFIYAAGGFDIY